MVRQIKPSRLEPKLNRIEEVRQIIYRNITPISEIGGAKLTETIGRMSEQICQLFPQPLPLGKIDNELYWQIKAILRGVQMEQQRNPNITWGTTLDAVLKRMNELEKLPQPLDDKELREKILSVVGGTCYYLNQPKCPIKNNNACELCKKQTDFILALLQPKIEEARRQLIKTLSEYTEGDIYGDAKTEEYMLFQVPVKVWQALKGGE